MPENMLQLIPSSINAGAVAMIAGLLVVLLVSIITPKMEEKKLDEIFKCLEEKVLVSKRKSIEE